jgi:hypothetical protein
MKYIENAGWRRVDWATLGHPAKKKMIELHGN